MAGKLTWQKATSRNCWLFESHDISGHHLLELLDPLREIDAPASSNLKSEE
jgi:hypothetical protein